MINRDLTIENMCKIALTLLLVEEIYICLLSMCYIIINEFCANKPHRLRRVEAMRGKGGQTNSQRYKLRSDMDISSTKATILLYYFQ